MTRQFNKPDRAMGRQSLVIRPGVIPLVVIRGLLQMTQQEFAGFLGVAASSISRWERGANPALTCGQFKRLMARLEPLGVSLHDLPDDLSKLPE